MRSLGTYLFLALICIMYSVGWTTGLAQESQSLVPPKLVRFVEASLPEGTTRDKEVSVELELTIAKDGRVSEVKVLKTGGEPFDNAAQLAAKEFEFTPAYLEGKAIAANIRYRYVFEAVRLDPIKAEQGVLRGRVVDALQGLAIPNALISLYIDGEELKRKTSTDERGEFEIAALEPNLYQVIVNAAEFGQLGFEEEIRAGEANEVIYRIGVQDDSEPRGFGVTAVADAPPREAIRRTIPKEQLMRIPGTRGDALRSVEILPGVGRPAFGIGALIVRGSAPQDSETFLEGVSVPLLYHFGGLTSFINGRLLEQIDFYPGNYSARYGRRTGGILEVSTRDPAFDTYHGALEISLIDAFVFAEGPITEKLSFALGVRRSIIDAAAKAFLPEDIGVVAAPVYYDYQFFLSWRPNKRDRVRFLSYGSNDRFEVLFADTLGDDPDLRGGAGLLARFHYLQLEWNREISKRVEQDITVMTGPTRLDFNIGDAIGFAGKFWQGYARTEWRIRLRPKVRLSFGSDTFLIPANIEFDGPRPRQSEGAGIQQEPISSQQDISVEDKRYIVRPGFYAESELEFGEMTRLVLGLRIDYFSEINEWVADPRSTLIVSPREHYRIKFGAGLYSQPPEFLESNPDLGNEDLEPIRSAHFGAGVEYDFDKGIRLGVESFYKQLWNRVISTPSGVPPFFENKGIGRIYGLEWSARWFPPDQKFFGYLSYSLSRSERRDQPGEPWRLFDFDQTHILTLSFVYKFKRGWELGGTFRYVSGNPITPVVGAVYDSLNDVYIPIGGAINSDRNPAFHRLDIRVEKQWKFQAWRLALFLDIQNAYNRPNQEGTVYNFDYTQSSRIKGLPIIPALGIRGEL